MDEETVRSVASSVLEGIDEDLLEYLISLIGSGDYESLSPFLVSAGAADDEDQADKLCERLKQSLKVDDAPEPPKGEPEDVPTLLKAPVSLAGTTSFQESTQQKQMSDFLWGTDKVRQDMNIVMDISQATSKRQERRAAKEIERARLRFVAMNEGTDDQMSQLTRMMLPELDSKSREKDIRVLNFDINYGGKTLLQSADLHLSYGRRYGLIGKNGIGKTTLLRHMAMFDIPGFPRHHRVLHVRQEAASSDITVLDTVLSSDVELMTLLQREREVSAILEGQEDDKTEEEVSTLSSELASVYERLRAIDADGAEGRASSILSGLGFSEAMKTSTLNDLSGGWRVRTALAAALFIEPHLLMLDEPTNHLDLEAVLWLQNYLESYKHTVLVVSHDRTFLNEVCTDMVLFQDLKLNYFKGNFDTFEKTRSDQLSNQKKLWDAYKEKRQHMQEFVDKFRANAKRASMVQSRIKAIDKLDAEAPDEPVEESVFRFSFPVPEPLGRPILQLDTVAFGYPKDRATDPKTASEDELNILFRDVNFGVEMDSRLGVVGPNGSGKSTLLNLLLSQLNPTRGQVHVKPNARIKVFTQHHADLLDFSLSALENLMQMFPKAPEAQVRAHLGRFGMSGDIAMRPCSSLSGGQKSRVSFAALAFSKPHIIIMDEPTNHLDIDTIDALIFALKEFKGGVLVVSHDQHFINQVCKEIWVVGGQAVRRFDGGFDEYKKAALKLQNDAASSAPKLQQHGTAAAAPPV